MSLLLEAPDTCSARPVFANQRCAYTCGVCQPDATPACKVAKPASSDVTLVSKEGQIVRGGFVQYTCRSGFVVTAGQLMRACGKDGQLMGQEPVCKDPDTIVQESNDVQLIQRAKVVDAKWAYTGVSANLRITRKGVIKQWKFFSPTPGWTVFQVWRPDSQAGEFSYILAGQNQVMTSGQGQETHNVAEADWIQAQSGDILGIWEPGESKPRGNVPYDECNKESSAKDFGASWIDTSDSYADFSRRHASKLSAKRQCLVFSFKAVIFPVSTDDIPSQCLIITCV
ncbi:hypothetical protein V1264_019732 [Littorina saxatilis]|uniref:Sushi domain-containing protein n=1 Tax=Littorina saxatilis TaxID=31220 RepID=A0AAN9BKV4_9CAEN